MALHSLSTSLVSATHENALALASMKLDVSMIKVEVPKEYTGLNAALTSKRRAAAEEGNAHKTARRLGILFQDLLPATPELLRAYGSRSSEIGEKMHTKSETSTSGGVFASFLGADITSIWAAATSGASSIAAHLLACLLARLWPASEATSIWVEIVAERRRRVQEESQHGVYKTSLELVLICRDEISRQDLAEWDAGARAWLQVADEAQMLRQKQLMLIVKNIDLPVNTQGSTYDRVLDAWTTALEALERLIAGQPQRVTKGATLLGIASWHLYPDLLVLGESMTPVRFKDELISPMGQLTVGLESIDPGRHGGIFWSLPLSHLRFYGDPVLTVANTRDSLRFSMSELQLLVFGSAITNWGGHFLDPISVAKFFNQLRKKLEPEASSLERTAICWLQPLFDASEVLLSTPEEGLKDALATVALGRRSGRDFVAKEANRPPPFFGIGQPFILSLLKGPPRNVQLEEVERMRYLATQLSLSPGEAIIRVLSDSPYSVTYSSAVPHVGCSSTFDALGPKHGNWFLAVKGRCNCRDFKHDCHDGRCTCLLYGKTCSPECHELADSLDDEGKCPGCARAGVSADNQDGTSESLASYTQATESDGTKSYRPRRHTLRPRLRCGSLPLDDFRVGVEKDPFTTEYLPPNIYPDAYSLEIGLSRPENYAFSSDKDGPQILRSEGRHSGLCKCYQSNISIPRFTAVAGNPNRIALFVRIDQKIRKIRRRLKQSIKDSADRGWTEDGDGGQMQPDDRQMEEINGEALRLYLCRLHSTGHLTLPRLTRDLEDAQFRIAPYLTSLKAFQLARGVYHKLSGATASLRVIGRPLHDALWIPRGYFHTEVAEVAMSRAHRFACIAFFESGGYDLDPTQFKEVIAISTRNSLYVSEVLLGDPFFDGDMNEVRHVMGNVGKTGVVMMVAPLAPRVRSAELNRWKQISHRRFNRDREDCFRATSLHLSFTDFEMPFDIGQRGSIDRDIHVRVVETVISVYDRADWVADLDVLLLYEPKIHGNRFIRRLDQSTRPISSRSPDQICRIDTDLRAHLRPQPLTSIDNWEELLNIPDDMGLGHIGVVRAHDNWIARLATACVAAQKGFRTVILPTTDVCWNCCAAQKWVWILGGDSSDGEKGDKVGDDRKLLNAAIAKNKWYETTHPSRREAPTTPAWQEVDDEFGGDDSDGSADSDDSIDSTGTVMANDAFSASPHIFIC